MRELHVATGGDFGGNKVTNKILEFIGDVVGKNVMQAFSEECKSDYLQLIKDVEAKKRKTDPSSNGNVTIKLPSGLLTKFCKMTGDVLSKTTLPLSLQSTVSIVEDKLRMQSKTFESFFADTVNNVLTHIKDLLESLASKNINVDVLVMVGGFSDSQVLQKAIKNEFNNTKLKIVLPQEASLCVVKGAVLFGFEPERITERISRYTYGIEQCVKYDPKIYPDTKTSLVNGKEMVDGVFDIHVRVGDIVKYGEFQNERVYYPMSPNDLQYFVSLYRSTKRDPKFTHEDGCERVECFHMKRPFKRGTSTKDETIKVKLAFGNSDIVAEVIAKDGTRIKSECIL